MRQSGLYPQSPPDFVHSRQPSLGLRVDEQMLRIALGTQLVQNLDRTTVERDRTNSLGLGVSRGTAPYARLPIDVRPVRV